MDALPNQERPTSPIAAKVPDGNSPAVTTAVREMLLGAAQRLAQTRDFAGNAIVTLPARRRGRRGRDDDDDDGLIDTFGIEQVYGIRD